jgi:carbonic anhydrase
VRLSRVIVVVLCLVAVSGFVYAGSGNGDESLTKLLDGNKRFASGELAKKDIGNERRQELTKGQHPLQHPFCSDSRATLRSSLTRPGDVFVVESGNVVEPTTLGSIEYGAEHLHTPLLVILGHESCGAVKATLEARGKPQGNIGEILKKIMPAVNTARKAKKDPDETLNLAVQENIKNTYNDVMKSKIVKELVYEGKLKVVAAEYYLGTGKVEQ